MAPYAEVFAFSPFVDLMKTIPTTNTPITTRILELAENFLTEKILLGRLLTEIQLFIGK